uniref:DUF937 domain-containing protein n=1 Tax=uncultured Altererythrobacter sp. TaxID=500840 RepID=UPI00260DF8ED|nr:DUF937 domain-containing protein [uncultured Altererythrobacter sp.]
MNLGQMLNDTGAIGSIAQELGIDESTARTAAGALLPAIVAGMGRSATSGSGSDPLGGLGSLAGAILGGGGGGLLESVLAPKPTPTQQGNDILGAIFGSKDVSRSVAGEVAGITGLDEGLLKQMLPLLAMAAAGYLAKGGGQSGGRSGGSPLGGILGSIIGGLASR